jgi:hypothetical protein
MTVHLCECGCGQPTKIVRWNHRTKGLVAGQPRRWLFGHHKTGGRKRQAVVKGYRRDSRSRQTLHRLRAERALGKPLPPKAVVHHADGTRSEDAPLVICQDAAYHRFLHRRMRIKAAGGNPNTDLICSDCQQTKPASEFPANRTTPTGHSYHCRVCKGERDRHAKRRAA